MTDQKILEVLQLYEGYLSYWLADDDDADDYVLTLEYEDVQAMRHVLVMIPQMRDFLKQGRREKVMRWLGFIQGVLWMLGEYTLEDLKNHNRPDAAIKREEE